MHSNNVSYKRLPEVLKFQTWFLCPINGFSLNVIIIINRIVFGLIFVGENELTEAEETM